MLKQQAELLSALSRLREKGFTAAIVNTTACGTAVKLLAEMGVRTVSLVHELPRLLRGHQLGESYSV